MTFLQAVIRISPWCKIKAQAKCNGLHFVSSTQNPLFAANIALYLRNIAKHPPKKSKSTKRVCYIFAAIAFTFITNCLINVIGYINIIWQAFSKA
ncbi:hypothetical protein [Rheinheimera pacifica]|uniref:hypothetical protein n=1 Tax=Rheinheimera pacifica TaxID=173990 RepID=UPI002EDBB5DC